MTFEGNDTALDRVTARAYFDPEPQTGGYIVMCYRGGLSVFGSAAAPLKDADGEVQRFDSMSDARAHATKLNAACRSSNLSYQASSFWIEFAEKSRQAKRTGGLL